MSVRDLEKLERMSRGRSIAFAGLIAVSLGLAPTVALAEGAEGQAQASTEAAVEAAGTEGAEEPAAAETAPQAGASTGAATDATADATAEGGDASATTPVDGDAAGDAKATEGASDAAGAVEGASDAAGGTGDAKATDTGETPRATEGAGTAEAASGTTGAASGKSGVGAQGAADSTSCSPTGAASQAPVVLAVVDPSPAAASDDHASEIDAIMKQFGSKATVAYRDGTYYITLTGDVRTDGIVVTEGQSWYVDLAGFTVTGTGNGNREVLGFYYSGGIPTFLVRNKDTSLSIGNGTVKGSSTSLPQDGWALGKGGGGDALRVTNGTIVVRDGTYLGGDATASDGIGGCGLSSFGAQSLTVLGGTLRGGYGGLLGGCGIYVQGHATHASFGSLPQYGTYKDPYVRGGDSTYHAGQSSYAGVGLAIEEVGHVSILSGDYVQGTLRGGKDNFGDANPGMGFPYRNSWFCGNDNNDWGWDLSYNYHADEIGPNFLTGVGMAIDGDLVANPGYEDPNPSYEDILSGHFSSVRIASFNFDDLFENRDDVVAYRDSDKADVDARTQLIPYAFTLSLAGTVSLSPTVSDEDGADLAGLLGSDQVFQYRLVRSSDGKAHGPLAGRYALEDADDAGVAGGRTQVPFTGRYTVENEDGTVSTYEATDGVIRLRANQRALVHALTSAELRNLDHAIGFDASQVSQAPAIEGYKWVSGPTERSLQVAVSKGEGDTFEARFDNVYRKRASYSYTFGYEGSVPEGLDAPEGGSALEGATVSLPTPDAVDGYRFLGWSLADGGALASGSFEMPGHDVALVGTWQRVIPAVPLTPAKPAHVPGPSAGDDPAGTTAVPGAPAAHLPGAAAQTPASYQPAGEQAAPRQASARPRHLAPARPAQSGELPATGDATAPLAAFAGLGGVLAALGARLRRRSE